MRSSGRSLAVLGGVIASLVAACAPVAPAASPLAGVDLLGEMPGAMGIVVHFPAARQTQTLPSSWDSVRMALTSSTALTASRSVTMARSSFSVGALSGGTSTVLFSGTRPAADYTLTAAMYEGTDRVAMGYSSPLTLSTNAVTSATITLSTLPIWTAATLANSAGTSGDGGSGSAAQDTALNGPRGMAAGQDGSLYVSEYAYNRIRQIAGPTVASTSIVTTLIGDGTTLNGPTALAYASNTDGLYIADSNNTRVRYVSNASTSPAFAANLSLTSKPLALAYLHDATASVDSVFVATQNNQIVQIFDPLGTPTTRILVGTGSVSVSLPSGLAVHPSGDKLYVSDTGGYRVLAVSLADGSATTVAGTGTFAYSGDGDKAASASFYAPGPLAFDSTDGGRLYVLDTAAYALRAVTLSNLMIATLFGNGTSTYGGDGSSTQAATLTQPWDLTLVTGSSDPTIFISDGNRIRSGTP